MSTVLDLMNQIAATWLARPQPAGAPFTVRTLTLTPDGAAVEGDLTHPSASGRVRMDVRVEPKPASAWVVHVTVPQPPSQLAPEVAAFRDVLERLAVHVDLDFGGAARPMLVTPASGGDVHV